MLTGAVTEFDPEVGLGRIAGTDGTSYLFHCIEIRDGTRSVDVGQTVTFEPLPRFGTLQAGTIVKG